MLDKTTITILIKFSQIKHEFSCLERIRDRFRLAYRTLKAPGPLLVMKVVEVVVVDVTEALNDFYHLLLIFGKDRSRFHRTSKILCLIHSNFISIDFFKLL